MKSAEIREAFLRYFESKSHQRVDSSSLIPDNDATLLFTNAGMNQFKDVFLGRESRPYSTATSSQRCVRAGGKHNDLDNVGYTARHHTFFEMLGNFSFGDYFKQQAIEHAWSFLTEELKLPAEKLWITVYQDDQEAEDIWLKHMGVSSERFSRLGEKDNFWSMGDTGPCGPCSEIFYDHGADVPGGPPGSPNEDQDRYIEIWNLVFMQYNRDANGALTPLPKPSVDTGMGLERLAAVLQGVHNNYDIDLFQNLISAVAAQCPDPVNSDLSSQRVIADHIRSCAFLVSDGLSPSNEGAGYVLRRITRRAIRHGHSLGITDSFFHRLVAPLVVEMGDAYPQLKQQQAHIEKVLLTEEEQFAKTLDRGMRLLEQDLSLLKSSVIPGETVFKLYDTYGFPVDLTEDIAREKGLTIDVQGFEAAMAKQKQAGKKAGQFGNNYNLSLAGETQFSGYDHFQGLSEVLALFADGEPVDQIGAGEEAILVLASTPFYAESGGQVGDVGYIRGDTFSFKVDSTSKGGDHHFHHGKLEFGQLSKAQQVEAIVDDENRDATALNHSATHLLHAVLRETLGDHVTQKGSLVDADKLRFDFSNNEGVTEDQLLQIERRVNIEIRRNTEVSTLVTDIDTARAQGAMALFGEKYGDEVRVLSMADGFSVELCGGTHVNRTGDIGLFKIVSESGIAAGIRRIEAVTGNVALELNLQSEQQLKQLSGLLKSSRDGIAEKVSAILKQQRSLEKQIEQMKAKQASYAGADLLGQVTEINGIKTLAAHVEGADNKALLSILDQLKNKMGSGIILLAAKISDDKVALVAGVSKDLCKQYKSGELIKLAAAEVGGKGGGRPDMAQAGGSQPENIPQALASLAKWLVK